MASTDLTGSPTGSDHVLLSFTERRQPKFAGYDAELKLNQARCR